MKHEGNHLNVGDNHTLYIETIGHPDLYPILFIHGGPGYGFFPQDKRFFDPEKHFVILYDQRGCGRSTPYGEVDNNTTQDLLKDINIILDHFGFNKITIFGGSWGSTLALLFAIQHPDRIEKMILRGIFSATHDTIDLFTEDDSVVSVVEARNRALALVPVEKKENPLAHFLEMMIEGDQVTKEKYAFEFELYGARLNFPDLPEEKIIADIQKRNYFAHALI